jgi:hypothetical protein
MNKIKIPKNWVFKYFEVEGNTTKFVYEDQLGIEHIYIDEKPEPELPTYEELEYKYNKQKEVLNRLKVVYTSMQFSAPENMYIFIEQMGDLLEELE